MVARSESLDRTVEDTSTNCLMLLSRVGECDGGGDAESRVFRCKTCMKEFSSFQALRGHRVSHKKPVSNSSSREEESGIVIKKIKTEKTEWRHRCSICGLEFQMGQALGGHMRKHWNKDQDSGGALVARSFFPEAAMTRALKKETSEVKGVACLESGSDWVDGINLKLELGRTMY